MQLCFTLSLFLVTGAAAQQNLRAAPDDTNTSVERIDYNAIDHDATNVFDVFDLCTTDDILPVEDGADGRVRNPFKMKPCILPPGERGPNPKLAPDPIFKKSLDQVQDKATKPFFMSCCVPKIPKCCPLGTENLWEVGGRMLSGSPPAVAQQPPIFNPKCYNSVDFDILPAGAQPFCHEISLPAASTIKSAQLELIIYSNPPCGKKDRLCLTTASENKWCTTLDTGENHLCLDLDELDLLDAGMTTLLVRVAYHSMVDYLRLHVIMCQDLPPFPAPAPKSMHFLFEPSSPLSGVGGIFSSVDAAMTPVSAVYAPGGLVGTSVDFPSDPPGPYMLSMPSNPAQQGGTALSMAVMVYYDEAGHPSHIGESLVAKYGSYRWMVNPGKPWWMQHIHLGPGFGDLRYAQPRPSNPSFTIPIQKWICLAVTIDVNMLAGTTTLKFYLNGALWGPPSVYSETYDMDGTSTLYINNANAGSHWKGKVDQFTLWQSVISSKEVNDYCNCNA